MGEIPVDKGRQTITSLLDQLRFIDPKIVPFDSPDIQDLEQAVSSTVGGVFGEDSDIFQRFREFRICLGHFSLKDSHGEKQMKYEMGLPKAINQLEEILEAMGEIHDDTDVEIPEIEPEGMVTEEPKPKAKAPPPPHKPPREKVEPVKPPETKPPMPKEAAPAEPRAKDASPSGAGSVLLLHTREDEISLSVVSLLDKLGIEAAMLDDTESSTSTKIDQIVGLPDVSFALAILSSDDRSGLPGLTAKIAKPKHRQDIIFELGFLVGKIGKGRVAVLHGGERPLDIPSGFYGIEYLSYQADGGWQINLIKLLKTAGYRVDANVLFE